MSKQQTRRIVETTEDGTRIVHEGEYKTIKAAMAVIREHLESNAPEDLDDAEWDRSGVAINGWAMDVFTADEAAEIEADNADNEESEVAKAMAKTLNAYKPRYVRTVAATGAASQDNGDEIAEALRAHTPDSVVALAERLLGMDAGELQARYASLNPGQRRMNAGNRIRGAVRRGDLDPEETLQAIQG